MFYTKPIISSLVINSLEFITIRFLIVTCTKNRFNFIFAWCKCPCICCWIWLVSCLTWCFYLKKKIISLFRWQNWILLYVPMISVAVYSFSSRLGFICFSTFHIHLFTKFSEFPLQQTLLERHLLIFVCLLRWNILLRLYRINYPKKDYNNNIKKKWRRE